MGKLSDAIVALDKQKVLSIVKSDLDVGRDPLELVDEARAGLDEVGKKFESGDFFLIELTRAAQVFQAAAELFNPAIREKHGEMESKGKMIIGTVAGDIHDLGKNIVRILLECKGIEVIDLGVNVPTEQFIESVREHKPEILGLSALLTASVPEMNKIITKLKDAGLRKELKIICGGGIVGEVRKEIAADFATIDANEGVKIIENWLIEMRSR